VKYSELERKLKKAGWLPGKPIGRHPSMYHPDTGAYIKLGHHKTEEVASGTLHEISRQTGIQF
jgi:predicted RNA binding protein YcfA (HicA-like mRNA interferase family)